MQTTEQKLDAYSQNQKGNINEDSRETDKRALLICAGQMQSCVEAGETNLTAYQEAVKNNQKLWTMFQIALTDPENELPNDLKILLLNLSRYVDKTSFQAVMGFNPGLVKSLVNINRTIAEGLAKSLKTQSPAIETRPQQEQQIPSDAILGTANITA